MFAPTNNISTSFNDIKYAAVLQSGKMQEPCYMDMVHQHVIPIMMPMSSGSKKMKKTNKGNFDLCSVMFLFIYLFFLILLHLCESRASFNIWMLQLVSRPSLIKASVGSSAEWCERSNQRAERKGVMERLRLGMLWWGIEGDKMGLK